MIKIAVTSYDRAAPASAIGAVFDSKRRTLGRGEGNFLVLPDAKNEVARLQAGVWSDGVKHTLVNLSQATPIVINGQEIVAERETDIHIGDQIQIGAYALRVELAQDGEQPAAAEPARAAPMPPAPFAATPASVPAPAAVRPPMPAMAPAAFPPAAQPAAAQPAAQAAAQPAAQPAAQIAAQPAAQPIPAQPAAAVQATAAAQPAAPVAETAQPAVSAPAEPAPAAADLQALKDAFLRGAGLPGAAMGQEMTPEFMELLGQLLSASIQGTIELMAHRTLVKQEVKTDMTVVVLRENNPLKFFPDSQTVMTQMLRKKMPGFMAPREAIVDAYHDLRGHQLAVVAGMRANIRGSVDAVLAQLRPENFAERLPAPGLMDKLVPSKRPAAMWSMYEQQYYSVVDAPAEEFKNVYGSAFQAAYEWEVDRHNRELPRA